MNHPKTRSEALALFALFAATLVFAGCGGGGGDGDGDGGGNDGGGNGLPLVDQFTLPSTPDLDGVVFGDNNQVQSRPDLQPGVGDGSFIVGETAGAARFVAYYSFDLPQIPAGRTIQSATLSLFNRATQGDPKGMMVLVRVDHVEFGNVFPAAPLGATGLDFNFATINDIDVTGRKNVDVTAQVLDDVGSGRSRSQYRLRGAIASNFDNVADVALLTDGEDSQGTGELPLLIIELE